MELWLATTNKGKLSEMKVVLEAQKFPGSVKSLQDLSTYSAPPETGQTYLDNARIKAKSLRALRPETYVLAEDSGLEVFGLNNLPGIHSARYAGPHARDSENNAKLLKMLQIRNIVDRSARFFCQMVVLTPTGEEWLFGRGDER